MEPDSVERRFEVLYAETYQQVLAYCRRRSRTHADADDAVAATYLVAWRRLDDFLEAEYPLAWLYRVAYRTLANQHRSRRRADALLGRLRRIPRHHLSGPDAEVELQADVAAAFRALATLSPVDQELIRLAAFENLSHAEIAVVVGGSQSSVRSKLHRARARLRDAARRSGSGQTPPEVTR